MYQEHLELYRGHKPYLLVIVEDSVHVLDPDGVDRAIEEHPLQVRHLLPRTRANQVGQNTVLHPHHEKGPNGGGGCFVCLACRRGECVKPWVARVAYIIHVKLETTHPDRTEIEPGLGRQGSQCTEDAYRFISSWLTCHSCVLSSNSP